MKWEIFACLLYCNKIINCKTNIKTTHAPKEQNQMKTWNNAKENVHVHTDAREQNKKELQKKKKGNKTTKKQGNVGGGKALPVILQWIWAPIEL